MFCRHIFIVFSLRSFLIFLVFVMILTTTHVSYKAEGKPNLTSANSFSKTINEEKATLLRGQIGSRPPRCEGRCSSCGHCEAIQVPANPQVQHGNDHSSTSNSDVSFARKGGGGNSNYKPLSWKCKCGNFIFNP